MATVSADSSPGPGGREKKDLSSENIPDLRRLLKKSSLDDDSLGRAELLARVEWNSIDWWGVLKNRVLVKISRWRVLFTVIEEKGRVYVEFFPDSMHVFPTKGCPLEKIGLYFCFYVHVADLADIRETLLTMQNLRVEFGLLYHGQWALIPESPG